MCEFDVSNIMCVHCRFFGSACKCIDHRLIHFYRPYFSSDTRTAHHTICSAFEPDEASAPAVAYEWKIVGGFEPWHRLFIQQWRNGKTPQYMSLILSNTPKGADCSDSYWQVPYEDFIHCRIMRPDGIHYSNYRYIKKSRASPIGYEWIDEGPGILTYEQLEELNHE